MLIIVYVKVKYSSNFLFYFFFLKNIRIFENIFQKKLKIIHPNLLTLKLYIMRKLLLFFLGLFIAIASYSQPIITAIVDGDCTNGTPKVLEIYANGTVDFSLFSVQNQTNANTSWGGPVALTSLGTVTDDFVYVFYDASVDNFATEFPSSVGKNQLENAVINLNGNDRIRIIETATTTVIDQYGEDGVDGTGTAWEYTDSYAKRNNSTGPDAGWNVSNWTFGGTSALNGGGTCQGGSTFESMMGGIGTYTNGGTPLEPQISNISHLPANPTSSESVVVSATITDDVAVTGATLYWATTTPVTTADNPTTMSNGGSGDIYSATIGAQANGTTVHYMIVATDGTYTTTTSEYSYTVTDPVTVDWCNLQYPSTGTINLGEDYNVYAQAWINGVTSGAGATTDLLCWIGYNTANTDPSTWTNWVPATFNVQSGENDEFMANIGTAISSAGTYYYASRWQYQSGTYTYGGYNAGGGGFWDGTTNVSGDLTVNSLPTLDVFFSEYSEAGSGNTKYIEIYNGSGSDIDLSTVTIEAKLASNGGAWGNTLTFPLTGTFAASDVYLIANSGSVQEILDLADTTSNITYFNGNDALGLFVNGVLVDVIGVQGVDPGTGWDVAGVTNGTADHTLVRKYPDVTTGTTDWATSAGTDAASSQWIVLDYDNYAFAGWHGYAKPVISNILTTPSNPTSVDAVTVNADVVDYDGTISSVVLSWGTTQGVYPNDITMNVSTGDTYQTATDIPAQTLGTTVYYIITATDNDTQVTVSEEQSYTVGSFTLPINIAITIEADTLVLIYDDIVSNFNATNYVLNPNTENITFGTSVQYNDTTIILFDPSVDFTEDVLLDTIYDSYNNTSYVFHAGIMPLRFLNTANTDIIAGGEFASFKGIVTADDEYNQVWIQDTYTEMGGVLIYDTDLGDMVDVGDSIIVYAERSIYNGMTELVNPFLINIVGTGLPTAAIISGAELDYNLSQDNANAEVWEGQFVFAENLIIDSLNSGYYEYYAHDCDGNIICIDDDADYHYQSGFTLTTGNMYDITGVVTFSNGHYKINPRGLDDATLFTFTGTNIESPETQVEGTLVYADTNNTAFESFQVMKFVVNDMGGDGLPTVISQVSAYAGTANTADFTSDIDGGFITYADTTLINFGGDPVITANSVVMPIALNDMIIADNSIVEFIVWLWLNPDAVDGRIIQFEIATTHGFEVFNPYCYSSPLLATIENPVTSDEFEIEGPASISEMNTNVNVYPNPVNDILNFNGDIQSVVLYDVLGNIMDTEFLNYSINMSGLSAGLYVAKVYMNDGSVISKQIIKK